MNGKGRKGGWQGRGEESRRKGEGRGGAGIAGVAKRGMIRKERGRAWDSRGRRGG